MRREPVAETWEYQYWRTGIGMRSTGGENPQKKATSD